MRLSSFAIVTLACALPATALADPAGKYEVRGINPDTSEEYRGTVSVVRTDETYKVEWKIAGQDLTGTGVGIRIIDGRPVLGPASADDTGMSVAYGSDGSYGTVVYFEQTDGTWHGIWAYGGWTRISTEEWIPKTPKVVVKREPIEKVGDDVRNMPPLRSLSTPMPALASPKS